MKVKIVFSIISLLSTSLFAQEFLRKLPERSFVDALSGDKFKNKDAVIILKEQSYKIENQEVQYRGYEFEGPCVTYTKIIIVKLLTELAVQRYGTFEYEYPEPFGDDIRNGFEARVRVLKPNNDVEIMQKEEVKTIVSLENSSGEPLARKVIFKVPNLSVGDVLQLEFTSGELFSKSLSRIFYYSDHDLVLYSNLYITLPQDDEVKYLSFPENLIGKPQISQVSQSYGAGNTYFWSVKNVAAVPDEPFAIPFGDQSLITSFIVQKIGRKFIGDWNGLAKVFYDEFLDRDKISAKQFAELGFSDKRTNISFETIDSLYTSLRQKFTLNNSNYNYPRSKDVNDVFSKSKGDASDISYIMYRMLQKWNIGTNLFWIKDKRKGTFESTVPTDAWFDRLGVSVKIGSTEKYYDFDRSIPIKYETPWYLRGISIISLSELAGTLKQIPDGSAPSTNLAEEIHQLSFSDDLKLKDDFKMSYLGSEEQKMRHNLYSLETEDVKTRFTDIAKNTCLKEVDSVEYNKFLDETSLWFRAKGESNSSVENVENYMTFKIKNELVSRFKSKISSATRKGHVMFDGPFEYKMEWNIIFPKGYNLKSSHSDRILPGFGNASGFITFKPGETFLNIKTDLKFPDSFVAVQNYQGIITFLDSIVNELDKDIVLEKIPEPVKPTISQPEKKSVKKK